MPRPGVSAIVAIVLALYLLLGIGFLLFIMSPRVHVTTRQRTPVGPSLWGRHAVRHDPLWFYQATDPYIEDKASGLALLIVPYEVETGPRARNGQTSPEGMTYLWLHVGEVNNSNRPYSAGPQNLSLQDGRDRGQQREGAADMPAGTLIPLPLTDGGKDSGAYRITSLPSRHSVYGWIAFAIPRARAHFTVVWNSRPVARVQWDGVHRYGSITVLATGHTTVSFIPDSSVQPGRQPAAALRGTVSRLSAVKIPTYLPSWLPALGESTTAFVNVPANGSGFSILLSDDPRNPCGACTLFSVDGMAGVAIGELDASPVELPGDVVAVWDPHTGGSLGPTLEWTGGRYGQNSYSMGKLREADAVSALQSLVRVK